MFLKLKTGLEKNWILLLLVLFAGAALTAPQFLRNKDDYIEVKTQSTATTKQEEPKILVKQETVEKTQGATTQNPSSTAPIQKPEPKIQARPVVHQITLSIDTAAHNYAYKVNWAGGMKVFEALSNAASQNGFAFKYENYGSWGAFVTQIHGVAGDWVFEVVRAGKLEKPDKGASTYEVLENDIIKWKKI